MPRCESHLGESSQTHLGPIRKDRYLTEQEQAQYEKIQAEKELAEAEPLGEPTSAPLEQIIDEPPLAQQVAVPHREITQADIDAAIQEWNGSVESKHAVVRYMKDHAREKDTAAWLRQEYGDNLPAFPVAAEGTAVDIPWPKVQRRIAQMIQEDRFYTQAEQLSEEQEPRFSVTETSDAFPDPEDVFAIWDRNINNYYADDYGTVQTFPDEESAQKYLTRLEPEDIQPVVPVRIRKIRCACP